MYSSLSFHLGNFLFLPHGVPFFFQDCFRIVLPRTQKCTNCPACEKMYKAVSFTCRAHSRCKKFYLSTLSFFFFLNSCTLFSIFIPVCSPTHFLPLHFSQLHSWRKHEMLLSPEVQTHSSVNSCRFFKTVTYLQLLLPRKI